MFQCNRAVDEPYGQIIIDHALLGVNRMIRFKSVSGVIQILVDGLHHDVVEDGFREGHEAGPREGASYHVVRETTPIQSVAHPGPAPSTQVHLWGNSRFLK